jgi:hypothetical protein
MKKLFLLFFVSAIFAGCQKFNIGPKGEGEYVIGAATVPYLETNVSGMKKQAAKLAETDALEKAVRVFLSSSSRVEYPETIKKEILAKPQNYIRRSYVKTNYRKGESYFLELRVMVLVSDLSAKIKDLEDMATVKKTNIFVASRETVQDEISLQQYCRQGIYKALKNYPYTLLDGGNLSRNNLEDYTTIIDRAKKDGARFVILADASVGELEGAATFTSSFKTLRAKSNIRVFSANNYQLIYEAAESASGLDAVMNIAVKKALTSACEGASARLIEPIERAVNSAKVFSFIVKDVNTIDRLERLQNILREIREVEDFNLVRYVNSNATFEVSANVSTSEEFSAKIIRKYYDNFTINRTGPDVVEMQFIQ